jgi:hypothetical protein
MSRFPDVGSRSRRGPAGWLAAGGAVVALAAGAWWLIAPSGAPGAGSAPVTASAGAATVVAGTGSVAPVSGVAPVEPVRLPAVALPPLSPVAQAVARQIEQLAGLPPGDAAITLARQLESSVTPQTAPAFREALLRATHPGVERVAISALARAADSELMVALAGDYGTLPPEARGRILQVLEAAGNPAALDGLTQIVAADTSEKRSPLVMSALYGIAHLGTMDSVGYLLRQTTTDSVDYALMALERVPTRQGVEMIRAAAAGSRGYEQISPSMRANLQRVAGTAEGRLGG